jgi:hypothetical protein
MFDGIKKLFSFFFFPDIDDDLYKDEIDDDESQNIPVSKSDPLPNYDTKSKK